MERGDKIVSSVDNRIVKMQFDNGQFESGAKTTLSTLQRLKEALNFTGAGKNLDAALNNAGHANLSGLEQSVDTVNNKFSILAAAASVALGNIAAQAISTGATLVKSFAIDPMLQGFQEYELKMNSIQTMMMSTGEPLERVNQKLNELNTYADKTIYSFSDMTQNIGKFTNAGVSLDKSVAAIQGVANVAALSGANANEASHAMYNFGQALSAGSVKLIDWKSIENANMATVEFKNELIKTALAIGTLTKEGDKYISTTTDLNGHVSEAFNATSMFNDSLSSQWMTTEVLTETLNRYADETTEIGKKAFKAATQVKTFSQLIDTTKESIGSGWAQTFEIIVGDFNEALELWTNIAGVIDKFVSKSSDARNDMLKTWKDLGGRTAAIEALSNVFSSLGEIMGAIGRAWEKAFPPLTGTKLYSITQSIKEFTERIKISENTVKAVESVFSAFFGSLATGVKMFGLLLKPVPLLAEGFLKLLGIITRLVSPIASLIDLFTNAVFSFDHLKQAGDILRTMFEKLLSPIKTLGSTFSPIFDAVGERLNEFVKSIEEGFDKAYSKIKDFNLRDALMQSLTNLSFGDLESIFSSATSFISVKTTLLKGLIEDFASWIRNFDPPSMGQLFDSIKSTFDDALTFVDNHTEKIQEAIKSFFDSLEDFALPKWGKSLNFSSVSDVFSSLIQIFQNGSDKVASVVSTAFKGFGAIIAGAVLGISTIVVGLGKAISSAFDSMGFSFEGGISSVSESIKSGLDRIKEYLTSFSEGAKYVFDEIIRLFKNRNFGLNLESGGFAAIAMGIKNLLDSFADIGENASKTLKGVTKTLDAVQDSLKAWQNNLKADTLLKIAAAIGVLAASMLVLSSIPEDELTNAAIAIAAAAVTLSVAMRIMSKISDDLGSLKLIAVGMQLIGLSAAVLIMSQAMKKLSDLDNQSLGRGILGVTAMVGELVAVTMIMSRIETANITKGVMSLLIFSQAIKTMAKAAEALSTMDPGQMLQGLTALGYLELGIGLLTKFAGIKDLKVGSGIALIGVATALLELAGVIKILGSIDVGEITQGLESLAILLGEIGIFTSVLSNVNGTAGTAAGLVVLGVALLEFTASVAILGAMPLENIQNGLIGLGAGLLALVAALRIMDGQGLKGAAAILVVAAALGILTPVLLTLGATFPVAVVGILVMAAALGTLGLCSLILSPLAPVILTLSAAMLALSAAVLIAGVGVSAIGVGLASTAAGLAALAAVAGPSIDAIILAIKKLGEGLLNAVIDLAPLLEEAFIALLEAIAMAIVDAADVIIDAFVALGISLCNAVIVLSDPLAQAFVELLTACLVAIADHTEEFTDAGIRLINGFINGVTGQLDETVATIGNFVVAFINATAMAIRDYSEPIIAAVRNLISSIIEVSMEAFAAFLSLIPGVGDQLAQSLLGTKNKVREALAPESMYEIGNEAGTGLANGFGSTMNDVTTKAKELAVKSKNEIETNSDGTFDIGALRGQEFGEGIGSMLTFANQNGIDLTEGALSGILSNKTDYPNTGTDYGQKFAAMLGNEAGNAQTQGTNVTNSALSGIHSNDGEYPVAGSNDGAGFANGVGSQSDNAYGQGLSVAAAGVAGAASQEAGFYSAGSNAGAGFVSGLNSWATAAGQAAASMANAAKAAAMSALDEHSPSKVFEWIANMAGEGMIIGFHEKEKDVARASDSMANSSITSMIAAVSESIKNLDDMDYTPTITPVLDMTEVQEGASRVQALLANSDFSFNGNVNADSLQLQNGSQFTELARSINADNADVVSELEGLREDIGKLSMAVSSMQIVLDSGVLVGQTVSRMNNALGMQQIYAERGM